MKTARIALSACILSAVFLANTASAQFHLPTQLGGAPNSTSSTNAMAAQDQLVRSFIASQTQVLAAQSLLAKAYGLKDQAAACDAQAKALQSAGTDTDVLKKTVDISESANNAISAQQAKQATLTADEKQYYVQSLPHFAVGVVGTRQVVLQAEKFTSVARGSGTSLMLGMSKLKAGLFIAKSTPSYSESVFDVFRKTVSIGQNNGISVPSDATQALQNL